METSSRIPVPSTEVQKHNSSSDCWIVVHSKVYDVTDFLTEHPGGSAIILKYAGADATSAYDSVHAPGIIEDTLPPAKMIGPFDQVTSFEAQPRDSEPAQTLTISSPENDEKPPICKLISAYDFEALAAATFTPKAWAFYSSAATDLVTHTANRDFFRRLMFRPRVMRNVKDVSTRRSILGFNNEVPFFISPAAMARLAHPEGELALARGAAREGMAYCVSSNASFPLASIINAGVDDQTFFLQLYVNSDRKKSAILLQKAKELGIRAIFVTVDAHVPGKREADERIAAEAVASPVSGAVASNDKKGGGMGRLMAQYVDKTLSWDDIPWIRETSQLPIVLKGIQSAADAMKAVACGVDGIMLSNHGGRSLDTAQPSMLSLLELHQICPDIFGKVEIYVDGGVTRGADILKAIALGATAVGIGRPYLYSLAYGDEGVSHFTQILKDELETSMRLSGITDVDQAHPGLINTQDVDHLVCSTERHPYITWQPKAKI
ncbi:hypothetical protein BP5796_12465 [Coleophoma crateriformis]|uniref:L-lactate dehydrogenase (cytochrome) n=1 Tax=Coleophoma crateriformis TaxID=565419 RepID=A0A3D8Q8A1_9HELO|nr:hypothetical protein BP5796_12465 [Coleophoma crateriformis]